MYAKCTNTIFPIAPYKESRSTTSNQYPRKFHCSSSYMLTCISWPRLGRLASASDHGKVGMMHCYTTQDMSSLAKLSYSLTFTWFIKGTHPKKRGDLAGPKGASKGLQQQAQRVRSRDYTYSRRTQVLGRNDCWDSKTKLIYHRKHKLRQAVETFHRA